MQRFKNHYLRKSVSFFEGCSLLGLQDPGQCLAQVILKELQTGTTQLGL